MDSFVTFQLSVTLLYKQSFGERTGNRIIFFPHFCTEILTLLWLKLKKEGEKRIKEKERAQISQYITEHLNFGGK